MARGVGGWRARTTVVLALALLVAACKPSEPSPTAPPAATATPAAQATARPTATEDPGAVPVPGLLAPFPAGLTASVVHGYNDPLPTETCTIGTAKDHCDNQRYGLDLGLDSDDLRIVAPVDGTVTKLLDRNPGATVGPCLLFTTDDGLNINLCHVGALVAAEGQAVRRGCVIATRDSSWIHLSIDDRSAGAAPYPPILLTGDHRLEGIEYEDQGDAARSQHQDETVTSTNEAVDCPPVGTTGAVSAAWVAPASGAIVTSNRVRLSATVDAGPELSGVSYTASWADRRPKPACTATTPDANGRWTCVADLAQLGAVSGEVRFAVGALDAAGTAAPIVGTERAVTYAPGPAKAWHWETIEGDRLAADGVVALDASRVLGARPITFMDASPCADDFAVGLPSSFGGMRVEVQSLKNGRIRESAPSDLVNWSSEQLPLADGRVLVLGIAGRQHGTEDELVPGAEIYDPEADRWTTVKSVPFAIATADIDGSRIAILGGQAFDGPGRDILVLKTANGRIARAASLPVAMHRATMAMLADGRLVVVSTDDRPKGAYVVDLTTGRVKSIGLPSFTGYSLDAWSLPDGGLAMAGFGDRTIEVAALDGRGRSWSTVHTVKLGWYASVFGHDAAGRLVVAGGFQTRSELCRKITFTDRVFAVDPHSGKVTNLPAMPSPAYLAWMTLLPDGRIAVGRGPWTTRSQPTWVLTP